MRDTTTQVEFDQVTPVCGRLRQEDCHEFKDSLGELQNEFWTNLDCRGRPCLRENKNKIKEGEGDGERRGETEIAIQPQLKGSLPY